jgi:hypothetical protein
MDTAVNALIYDGDCFGQVYQEKGRHCKSCGVKDICKKKTQLNAEFRLKDRLEQRGGTYAS